MKELIWNKYRYITLAILMLVIGNCICYYLNNRYLTVSTNFLVLFAAVVNTKLKKLENGK